MTHVVYRVTVRHRGPPDMKAGDCLIHDPGARVPVMLWRSLRLSPTGIHALEASGVLRRIEPADLTPTDPTPAPAPRKRGKPKLVP